MKMYLIKLSLRGVSPLVWRRLRLPGDTSLAMLHAIIQLVNNWDDEYLHQFHIYGKDYGIAYEGGLSFADNAHRVSLDDFEFDVGDKFTYEYNFFQHWIVDIRIEAIDASVAPPFLAVCIKGNKVPGVTQRDEIAALCALLKVLANKQTATNMKVISPLIEKLVALRFNRHDINRRLRTEIVSES